MRQPELLNGNRLISVDRRQRWRNAILIAARDFRHNPIQDPISGELLTDLQSISQAWETHYRNLASDSTGHSRDPEWWRGWHQLPERRHLTELDGPINRAELVSSLKRMKRHKAPGEDGIPVEFLGFGVGSLTEDMSPMEKVLLKLVNLMFETGVPDAKKEDLAQMDNYRGISLMSTVLKILVTILSDRVNRCFEAHSLFSPAQKKSV